MSARFAVLASGSGGNAAFLSHRGFGLLVDCGIGPRVLSERLAAVGAKWTDVSAVLLTHTHGDHWKTLTLQRLRRERVPLLLHARHAEHLEAASSDFADLAKAGLVRTYADGEPCALIEGLDCRPVRVPHDSDPTFAFRIDGVEQCGVLGWSLGYASDLGRVTDGIRSAFRGVDLLALEFNHDVDLQRRSHRPPELVARVLGDRGHLSNEQAAEFVRFLHRGSEPRLQAIVQLHLSRECNDEPRAVAAARAALAGRPDRVRIVTAQQDRATPALTIMGRPLASIADRPRDRIVVGFQPSLPGLSDGP
jgi:phosphoribosyl 1,2-cyclic phosphodiesterase